MGMDQRFVFRTRTMDRQELKDHGTFGIKGSDRLLIEFRENNILDRWAQDIMAEGTKVIQKDSCFKVQHKEIEDLRIIVDGESNLRHNATEREFTKHILKTFPRIAMGQKYRVHKPTPRELYEELVAGHIHECGMIREAIQIVLMNRRLGDHVVYCVSK